MVATFRDKRMGCHRLKMSIDKGRKYIPVGQELLENIMKL